MNLIILMLIGVSLALNIGLGAWVFWLHRRWKKLFAEGQTTSIEQPLMQALHEISQLQQELAKTNQALEATRQTTSHHLRTPGVHRFSAFEGGGKQSFAAALVNSHGDGVVLSSLNVQGKVNVYAKQIHKFKSNAELIPEEQVALDETQKAA